MTNTDPRIDAYIEAAAPFARPILETIRTAVHNACPDAEESVRWSMPSFGYKGKILCQMAAFKAHATFGFWQGREVTGETEQPSAMGQFGRLTRVEDLPATPEFEAMIRRAMELIDAGTKAPRPVKHPRAEIGLPEDFGAALAANPAAQATYDSFAPSSRREYLEWVVEAKRPDTRVKRIAQAVEWMAEGKRRHWKYEKC